MYLSTFIDDDGYITDDSGKRMGLDDVIQTLGVSPCLINKLISDTFPNEYIMVGEEGKLKFGDRLAFKQLPNWLKNRCYDQGFGGVTRLYTESVRFMYDSSVLRKKKGVMSNIYYTLPYLHSEYNIACWNPEEKNPANIIPVSIEDFDAITQIEEGSVLEIINTLEKHTFEIDGRTEKVFAFAPRPDLGINKMCAHVNPHIVYAGHKENAAKALAVFQ